MTTWKETALSLYDNGSTMREIADFLWGDPIWSSDTKNYKDEDAWYHRVRDYIYYHRRQHRKINNNDQMSLFDSEPISHEKHDDAPEVLKKKFDIPVQNQEPSVHDALWDGATIIKFGLMGDTQIGSKYAQISHLNEFYDICERSGVRDVYHTGDITDGLKMRTGHEYELYMTSADDLVDHVAAVYPKREGIITHFITGNHDASIYKQVGYDIGRAIDDRREDMEYLGRDCAVVNLTPNCTMELRHPWDGTAYSISYKTQKMIEAMESDSKPNILAIGHYHKAEYLFYRNIHCIQTGCFQSQTPFTRGKGIAINMGGWIVTVAVDSDGTICGISPMFIPFYKACTDDYKKYI